MFKDFSGWLRTLGSCSEAFIWRHGWVGQIVVGMLVPDPKERLSVIDAAIIMENGLRSRRNIQNAFQEVLRLLRLNAPMGTATLDRVKDAFKFTVVKKRENL